MLALRLLTRVPATAVAVAGRPSALRHSHLSRASVTPSKAMSSVAAAASGAPPPLQPPTIIDAVVCDHRNVSVMLTRSQQAAQQGDKDLAGTLASAVAVEVIMHSRAEEQVLYPFCVKKLGEEGKHFSDHSAHEHEELEEKLMAVVQAARGGDMASLAQLVGEAQKAFEHHKHDEEDKYLPKLVAAVPAQELRDLTQQWVDAKQRASLEQLGSKA